MTVVVALIPDLKLYIEPVHIDEVELGMILGHEVQPTSQTINRLV